MFQSLSSRRFQREIDRDNPQRPTTAAAPVAPSGGSAGPAACSEAFPPLPLPFPPLPFLDFFAAVSFFRFASLASRMVVTLA